MQDLRSGDLCIPGSDRYSVYRGQLVTEEEFRNGLASYGERAGVPVESAAFVASSKSEPAGLKRFEKLVKERMEPVGIMEALSDTQEWPYWTRHFGPISGNDPKLENPTKRYLVTTFCYGFDLGPTQTSRSIRSLDRRQVAFVNQRHVTEENLVRAPMANSVCERFGGTLRRECLDFLIPLNERHLKMTVKEWGLHYNRGRPHSSLGPGLPEPNQDLVPASDHRHSLPAG